MFLRIGTLAETQGYLSGWLPLQLHGDMSSSLLLAVWQILQAQTDITDVRLPSSGSVTPVMLSYPLKDTTFSR